MNTLVVARSDRTRARVTARGCAAAGLVGMALDRADDERAGAIEITLEPGGVVLVRGASGSGKSTLLEGVAASARASGWRVIEPARLAVDGSRACIDAMGGDVATAARRLARAGLADARLWLRPAGALSAGERARLELGLAMERAEVAAARGERALIVIDSMCEALDRVTARGVAMSVARAVSEARGVAVVAASVREDLEGFLCPRRVVEIELDGTAQEREGRGAGEEIELKVERGGVADYVRMARWHYRSGAPATWARVLRAEAEGSVVGVLVVSMAALNASWRREAWGEAFASGDRAADAAAINQSLRCISRVVVDPRWRGLGVARRLVEAYLHDPVTPCTETVAAMGRFSGFFEAAGMRRIELLPSARDERLRAALESAGLGGTQLAMTSRAAEAIGRAPELVCELRRWARASRATARHADGSLERLAELAWRSIAARRVAFVHGSAPGGGR